MILFWEGMKGFFEVYGFGGVAAVWALKAGLSYMVVRTSLRRFRLRQAKVK